MKGFISRISSRKFIVWVTGTLIFILTDKLPPGYYILLCGIFIGGKIGEAIIELIKAKKTN